jgi:hypothetical protein
MSAYQVYRPSRAFLATGLALKPGWKVSFFLTGTSTPTPVYTSSALDPGSVHTQPVQALADGTMPAIYLDASIVYKCKVYDENNVFQYEDDPVNDNLLTQGNIGALLNPQTQAEIDAGVTPTNYAYPECHSKRYGETADWNGLTGTDNSTAFQNALNVAFQLSAGRVLESRGAYYLASGLTINFGCALEGEAVTRQALPGNWISGNAYAVNGTQIFTNAGSGSTTGRFFRCETGSSVRNINIWYTGQTKTDTSASIVQYPPTFDISTNTAGHGGANADNVTIHGIGALNCYEFMRIGDGANPVGRTIVEDVYANPFYKGVTIQTQSGDVAMLRRVYIENLFTTDPTNRPTLFAYLKTNLVAFDLGYAQGVNLTDCIALNCGYGLKVADQTWCQVENFLADTCSVPFYANGAHRVMVSNSAFINNSNVGAPAADINGDINQLVFSGTFFGAYNTGTKLGAWCKHTSGTVVFNGCAFSSGYPAVLNTGSGKVVLNGCTIADETNNISRPITYRDVVGKGISIDGRPELAAGSSLGLSNINPTKPAATGWTYTTAANVTVITGGISISGSGNNSITYRPADVSSGNNGLMFWNTQLLLLEFDFKVTNQAGSPRLELLILNDVPAVVGNAYQLCADANTGNSALPEGQTFHVAVLLPWCAAATQLRLNLPGQTSAVYEITNLDIKKLSVPMGRTGLELLEGFSSASEMPLGWYDAATGRQRMRMTTAPAAGAWLQGDRVDQYTDVAGNPKGWRCTVAGSPGTWVSTGNL